MTITEIVDKTHESKLIKSILTLKEGKPRAVYLTDGTKISIEYAENGGSWLKVSKTPHITIDEYIGKGDDMDNMQEKIKAMQEKARINIGKYGREIRTHVDKYGPCECDYLIEKRGMLNYHRGEYNALVKLRD